MTTANTYSESDDTRRSLETEIVSMKKQSILSLMLAILFVLIAGYLYFELQESSQKLIVAQQDLEKTNQLLVQQKDSLASLKNELDQWRVSQISVNEPVPDAGPDREPDGISPERPVNRYQTAGHRTKSKHNPEQAFLGYIIYIHDRNNSKVSVALEKLLLERGAIVPAIEHIPAARHFGNAVKYFHEQDRDKAVAIQKQLGQILSQKQLALDGKPFAITYLPNPKVSLGQLEVWIDR